MMKNGFYKYDPTNYHGPLHFYVLLLSQTLFGPKCLGVAAAGCARKHQLRVASIEVRAIRWTSRKSNGGTGNGGIAGFVFYGRYSIHEVWLVLFSMLFILGLLGLWKAGTRDYLWCAGMGLAGMILTKETYIIHLGCAALAVPS